MAESYRFTVCGRVQGVFFRQSTREQAVNLGLGGWVRNCDDGSVEGAVCGEDAAALSRFREWLERGPPRAQVKSVDWAAGEMPPGPYPFEVRR